MLGYWWATVPVVPLSCQAAGAKVIRYHVRCMRHGSGLLYICMGQNGGNGVKAVHEVPDPLMSGGVHAPCKLLHVSACSGMIFEGR